ncbi:unnamed protein product [Didymodactylos carnosus]|uniref:Retrotransposon gag domain-containing protein n=1 Tax=Didymodactylos carnosus TaxID=1234261 RepID=A0A8S2Y2R6_9BILA|nr:unnamed protein product [Didymodactylos carnosus]
MADPLEVIKLIQQFSGECKQDGTGEPKHSVQSWCDHADITFGTFNIIDADRVRLIPTRLVGLAAEWYQQHRGPYTSWAVFAAAVITAFSRQKSLLAVDKELSQRLKKSDESVQEYGHAKLKLCNQYNPQMTQAEKVMKLIQGLPPDMQAEAHLLQTRQLIQTTDQFVTAVQNLQEAELIRNSVVQGSLPYEQVEPVFCLEPLVAASIHPAHYQQYHSAQRTVHIDSQRRFRPQYQVRSQTQSNLQVAPSQ